MQVIDFIYLFIQYLVVAAVVVVILLMLLRLAINFADLNPFSRPVLFVRKLTDPFVNPVRRALLQYGFTANMAPLVVILLTILLGWFALLLTGSLTATASGMLKSAGQGRFIALVGFLLYGLLDIYRLLIFIRIIFSWGNVGHGNRVMRFLVKATDPLLAPLRRVIPPLGMFDISPIVALLIIMLFQSAIHGTLLQF